ncbi:serine hydrolase domain-containing protein [Marinicella sp. W31]|uniref:serine hydrolase domain-containing protein n=1 Tax=Marinicella sp. W31 TaxID=3023713 RepID=UPI003757E6A0
MKKHYALVLVVLMLLITERLYANPHQSLIEAIDNIRQQHEVSAAVVILVNRNQVLINRHLGIIDWNSKTPFSGQHMFRVGSISKSFAAILALRLQEAGLIDLDKPLNAYIKTEVIKNQFSQQPITLAQLLEHTAGLSDMSKAEWDYNAPSERPLHETLALHKNNHITLWPPGQHASYTNIGAGVLGLAMEKATGNTYEKLMQQYVFEPLGMSSSTLLHTATVKEKLITGYNTDGKTPIPYWHNIYRPFAAINTNSTDMIHFLQMMLNRGTIEKQQFISDKSFKRMQRPLTTLGSRAGLQYGYGLGNYQWQTNGHSFYGHGGDADGYLAHYGYNEESGHAYFVMISAFQHTPLRQMRQQLESFITAPLPKPKYPKRLSLKPQQLHKFTGAYAEITKRFGQPASVKKPTLWLEESEGTLYTRRQSQRKRPLYAVDSNLFRRADESMATIALIEHNGNIYLQGDIGNFIKIQ